MYSNFAGADVKQTTYAGGVPLEAFPYGGNFIVYTVSSTELLLTFELPQGQFVNASWMQLQFVYGLTNGSRNMLTAPIDSVYANGKITWSIQLNNLSPLTDYYCNVRAIKSENNAYGG